MMAKPLKKPLQKAKTAGPSQAGAPSKSGEPLATHTAQLDRLIHDRTRLGILSALAVTDSLSFSELKKLLQVTDGNLSVHARKLEEARYVTCTKIFEGRVPKTKYRLNASGRRAFERYLKHMESLIEAARKK